MHKIIAFLILIIGLVTYSYAPIKYNYNFSVLCAVLYGIVIVAYYLIRRKKNYFDFDSIFFFTFFFVTLYYPVFLFETDPTRYVFFLFSFDKDVLPLSSAAALLAICSYLFGSLLFAGTKRVAISHQSSNTLISNRKFYWVALILFLAYFATGGYAELRAVYFGGNEQANPVSKYLFLFCPSFLFAGIISDFYNSRILHPNKIAWRSFSAISFISTGIIMFALIIAGSRTIPLQLLLMIFGLYALLYKNISFTKFSIALLSGLSLMFLIVVARGFGGNNLSIADTVMDLVINNRNTFLAVEYVQKEGYTFGSTMITGLAAPIPFLQNLFLESGIPEEMMSSAKLFTFLTYGENFQYYGVGTNVVADLYISVGPVGIVILMCLLGYTVNQSRVLAETNIFYLALYAILISYAVYLVRAEFFFYMRNLIWTMLILYISKKKFIYS